MNLNFNVEFSERCALVQRALSKELRRKNEVALFPGRQAAAAWQRETNNKLPMQGTLNFTKRSILM